MDALILAGGLGTRLRSVVADRAKPVAVVHDTPFVMWMMRHVAASGIISRFVLCTGHLSDTVRTALGDQCAGVPIEYVEEREPLGTGGALRHALLEANIRTPFLALNGDTFLGLDLVRMKAAFTPRSTDVLLALSHVEEGARYGKVQYAHGRITAFQEKGIEGPGWINAGVYLFSAAGAERLRAAPRICSLEKDVFPASLAAGRLHAYRSQGRFLDIGVPEDYQRAATLFEPGRRKSAANV
jgi:D-glycero-alpha-D-manno-heptose 1-phosphate guanylyltransferase